jgi:hypothetical protein
MARLPTASIEERRDDALSALELAEDEVRWKHLLGTDHVDARVCDECWLGMP